jgi:hypothetical protein
MSERPVAHRRTALASTVTLITALICGVLIATGARAATTSTVGSGREHQLRNVYVTGYTWFDNTPRGSASISDPVRHRTAGGAGTYSDPVTLAVGHTIVGGRDVLDLPAGTRLDLPHLRRYAIVEDTCGDGPRPQTAPCHDLRRAPRGASLWLDLYVGGGPKDNERAVSSCAGTVTDGDGRALRTVIVNPRPGLLVRTGLPFSGGRCTPLYR